MTVRDIYEAVLVEINKENAQSFTIEEFNYIVNKSVLAFVNKKYNFYPTNQQLSDDLRVLVKNQTFNINDTEVNIDGVDLDDTYNLTSSYVTENGVTDSAITVSSIKDLAVDDVIAFGDDETEFTITAVNNASTIDLSGTTVNVYRNTPIRLKVGATAINSELTSVRTADITFTSSDYLHLVSCRVLWKTKRPADDAVTHIVFPAKRLTYDMLNAIQNNTYLNPAPNRPYYQVFNNSNNSGVTTFPSSLNEYKEYQNKPSMKLHVGNPNTFMELVRVEFDYLKLPEFITLKDEDIFTAEVDNSQVLEWPGGLLNEIVKLCTMYLLEKSNDPRIQTQPLINQDTPDVPINMQTAAPPPKQRADTTQQQY